VSKLAIRLMEGSFGGVWVGICGRLDPIRERDRQGYSSRPP
jgi:hypothetical protein